MKSATPTQTDGAQWQDSEVRG